MANIFLFSIFFLLSTRLHFPFWVHPCRCDFLHDSSWCCFLYLCFSCCIRVFVLFFRCSKIDAVCCKVNAFPLIAYQTTVFQTVFCFPCIFFRCVFYLFRPTKRFYSMKHMYLPMCVKMQWKIIEDDTFTLIHSLIRDTWTHFFFFLFLLLLSRSSASFCLVALYAILQFILFASWFSLTNLFSSFLHSLIFIVGESIFNDTRYRYSLFIDSSALDVCALMLEAAPAAADTRKEEMKND